MAYPVHTTYTYVRHTTYLYVGRDTQTIGYFYIIRRRRSRSAAAYSDQTFQWTIGRSVRRSVCPVHCGKTGGSDPDAVWRHRSDGSRDETGSGVWGSVHGKGYFWGRIWGAPL